MNLTINGKAIKTQTLVLLGLVIAGSAASQVAAVNHFLSYHPHLAPLGSFLLMAIALLHNPTVDTWFAAQKAGQPQAPVSLPTPKP
jgi:hypothetical protein